MEEKQTPDVVPPPAKVSFYSEATVPTEYGNVQVVVFRDDRAPPDGQQLNEHVALVIGDDYGDELRPGGILKTTADLTVPVSGKHVLLVDDVVSTGMTMSYLQGNLAIRGPLDVKVCALLHRPARTPARARIDYVGFPLDTDAFVFGYGMDCRERYSELPFIATHGEQPAGDHPATEGVPPRAA